MATYLLKPPQALYLISKKILLNLIEISILWTISTYLNEIFKIRYLCFKLILPENILEIFLSWLIKWLQSNRIYLFKLFQIRTPIHRAMLNLMHTKVTLAIIKNVEIYEVRMKFKQNTYRCMYLYIYMHKKMNKNIIMNIPYKNRNTLWKLNIVNNQSNKFRKFKERNLSLQNAKYARS